MNHLKKNTFSFLIFLPMECSFAKSASEKLYLSFLTSLLNSESRQRSKKRKIHYSEFSRAQILGISVASSWPKTWRTCILFPVPSYNSCLDLWPSSQRDSLMQVRNVNCQNAKRTWLQQDQMIPLTFRCMAVSWGPQLNTVSQRRILSPKQLIE